MISVKMTNAYYPPSPVQLPKGLTRLTPSYQLKAILAILSILLFFVLYFALVASFGYLLYWAVTYDIVYFNKITFLLKLSAIAGAGMLFAFTLKFIFKLKNHQPTNRMKIHKENHPELFHFVYQICKETGAPKPKSIYVDPDVNAYVSYNNMWLSLLLPVGKDLTIGLGLVSSLNLTEFKAVIAHEFGHFAQRSMKIGSYIISANAIIHDMIFTRDRLDHMLDEWRSLDIRFSTAAWIITPIIWVIRQMLSLFYALLNLMYSSLSREMEFNADKVAVSVTGSDAIVSALWKLDGGTDHWNSTINHAYLAAQKKLHVRNLYMHNDLAVKRAVGLQQERISSLPMDSRGGKKYFSSSESSRVNMYASHPPNDLREHNAKVPYIACAEDQRSPWLLFSNAEALQEEMSTLIYQQYLGKAPGEYIEAEAFERFIEDETQGAEQLSEYHNTFEGRFIHIPTKEEMYAEEDPDKSYRTRLIALKSELTELMKPVQEIENLMLKAQQIAEGTSQEKSFTFNGSTYEKKQLPEGYNQLVEERERLFNVHFKSWDIAFCNLHLTMAKKAREEKELVALYQQHAALSEVYRYLVKVKNSIYTELHALQQKKDVTQREVNTFGDKVNERILAMNVQLSALDELEFVPLPNIEHVQELKEAIVEGGEFKREAGPMFENGGFNRIMASIENAIIHCQRLDQKSIAVILKFHHALHQKLEKEGKSSNTKSVE